LLGELGWNDDRGGVERLLGFLERFDRIAGGFPGDQDRMNPAQKLDLARQLKQLVAERPP
jgi:hypothetical protein